MHSRQVPCVSLIQSFRSMAGCLGCTLGKQWCCFSPPHDSGVLQGQNPYHGTSHDFEFAAGQCSRQPGRGQGICLLYKVLLFFQTYRLLVRSTTSCTRACSRSWPIVSSCHPKRMSCWETSSCLFVVQFEKRQMLCLKPRACCDLKCVNCSPIRTSWQGLYFKIAVLAKDLD